jgi:CelD/BcsL family acetyltransferase involved in cellulose biosynthesis
MTRVSSLESVEGAWEALADRVDADPWMRPGWFRAWTQAFAKAPLQCLVLPGDDGLRGLVPVLRRSAAVVSPTNWHSPGFGVLAEDEETRSALLEGLILNSSSRVSLRFIDETDAAALLHSGRQRRAAERVIAQSPYVDLSLYALSKNTRRNVRRARQRLEKRGAVTLEIVTGNDDLGCALEEGFAVEAAGWKGRGGSAIRSRAVTRGFYENVARWAADRGALRLFFLRADGRAVAFEFAIQDRGRLYDLKGGFDEAFADASPGVIITESLMQYAMHERLSMVELLGDREDWKLRWATGERARHEVQIFGRTPAATAQWLTDAHARPVARRLRAALRS